MADSARPPTHRPSTAIERRFPARSLVGLAVLVLGIIWGSLTPRGVEPYTSPKADVRQRDNPNTAFEPKDWPVGPVALIFLLILVLVVICPLVLIAAYPTSLPDVSRTLRIAPPGPRLQTSPEGDLARVRTDEERRLNSYYWVDRQKGTVHIPIEQAMQNLAKTGVPGFPREQQ